MLRKPECLLLVVDCGPTIPTELFPNARDVAKRMARTRVLYGQPRSDRMGLIVTGSAQTRNALADENPGGYANIDVVVPVTPLSIDILRALQSLEHTKMPVNILNVLEVAGDHVASRSSSERLQRRIVLFTDARGGLGADFKESVEDIKTFAKLCVEEKIRFDVVFVDGLSTEDLDADAIENDSHLRDSDDDAMVQNDTCNDCSHDRDLGDQAKLKQIERVFSNSYLEGLTERRRRRYADSAHRQGTDGTAHATTDSASVVSAVEVPGDGVLRQQAVLIALAMSLDGSAWSLSDAASSVDQPQVRDKNAVAKFRGVFDIAGVVKIPVKVYTFVSEAKRPGATKLSWDMTKRQHKNAYVVSKTRYVPVGELESGVEVEPEDVMDAYPYGPNLVSEKNEIHGYSWEIACPKEFKLICCVRQSSVPVHQFMSSVDVVLPMSGVPGCEPQLAMRALVTALSEKNLGIAARLVARDQGKPKLVYLWPHIERQACDERDDEMNDHHTPKDGNLADECSPNENESICESWYLYMVELPTGHDIKHFPFASLKDTIDRLAEEAVFAMDSFISSMDLDDPVPIKPDEVNAKHLYSTELNRVNDTSGIAGSDGGRDETEHFEPSEWCNPVIDRFNVAIIERAIGVEDGSEVPDLPRWTKDLINPLIHIPQSNIAAVQRTLEDIKNLFPITKLDIRQRRARRHFHAASGDLESVAHLMPPTADDEKSESSSDDEVVANGDHERHRNEHEWDENERAVESAVDGFADNDNISVVTDCPLMVSDESPVADFKALIKHGHYNEAYDTMSTVVYRKIREGDILLAVECVAAFRDSCRKLKQVDEFHNLLQHILIKSRLQNSGDRTFVAFIRHVYSSGRWTDTLAPLRAWNAEQVKRMVPSIEDVEEIAAELSRIGKSGPSDQQDNDNASFVTTSMS